MAYYIRYIPHGGIAICIHVTCYIYTSYRRGFMTLDGVQVFVAHVKVPIEALR